MDEFELYDLRVELVAPEGAKIYCGKVGDWFELHGEQLHMPPGQSFSIYSLSSILPPRNRLPLPRRDTERSCAPASTRRPGSAWCSTKTGP